MKVDLYPYIGFAIARKDTSLEASRLHMYCVKYDYELIRIDPNRPCPEFYIPCGSVEWCQKSLGKTIIPDYYPSWLEDSLHRNVWREDNWILDRKLFVKPADKYKRFTGFVTTGTYKQKKRGSLIWSEVVQFTNEWRYYVTEGKVVASGWYSGDEVNTPDAPLLNIKIPKHFSGAVDFGTTVDSKFALVESHHPFACGWYGKQSEDHLFFQWLIDGWKYMKEMP